MRVIVLCSNYEPGGAQRAVVKLSNAINRKGIDCSCWFIHRKSKDFMDSKPNLLLDKKITSPFDILRACVALWKVIKREKPDAVISFLPYANILGLLISFFCGVKKRVSSHRNLSDKELGPLLKFFDFLWARFGIYTDITAVSQSTKDSFRHYGEKVFEGIKVINNGSSFSPSTISKDDCREKLGLEISRFIIGNVGRLVEQKNHILLVNILPQLKDIRLVIVGKGELRKELEFRARELGVIDRVTIIDELNIDMIPHFLKSIDIFVMPSHFEGMSNALAEALYAGLPIVSSNVESQSDVLVRESDGLESGILISNEDAGKWVDSILSLKNNKKLREDLSQKALIRSKDFTIENMANGFISLL